MLLGRVDLDRGLEGDRGKQRQRHRQRQTGRRRTLNGQLVKTGRFACETVSFLLSPFILIAVVNAKGGGRLSDVG